MPKDDNYLIERLENNIDTKIIFIGDEESSFSLMKLQEKYHNLEVLYYENIDAFINTVKNSVEFECDFIIYYNSLPYDKKVLDFLREVALNSSNDTNCRVSLGYSCDTPDSDKIKYPNFDGNKVLLYSYKDFEEYEESTYLMPNSIPLDLINMTIFAHNEMETELKLRLD